MIAFIRLVLVTNFRAFAVVGQGPPGKPCVLESFTLAESESDFWRLTAHPRLAATEHGERMLEYLKRVLLLNAPLAAPQDVAGILASYTHDARLRVEKIELPALMNLRQALEEALGLRFEGDKGEHFFRSTLIQTLFYGVFSAWVLWARRRDAKPNKKTEYVDAIRASGTPYAVAGGFDWRVAPYLLRVPMLRGLFVQVADPARLGALGLIEVLDWAAATLNRVNRAEFFKSFDEGHAIQYFYEPFLQAFDPELRKVLGWHARWGSETRDGFCELLRKALHEKVRKLAKVEAPWVLLLIDAFPMGDPEDWIQALSYCEESRASHTIARLGFYNACLMLKSDEGSWIRECRH